MFDDGGLCLFLIVYWLLLGCEFCVSCCVLVWVLCLGLFARFAPLVWCLASDVGLFYVLWWLVSV